MEPVSIKTLAMKALQGNRQGNQTETGSFQAGIPESPVSGGGNSPAQAEDNGKPYTIIFSRLLDDFVLLVHADAQAEALRRQGVEDVCYTAAEVQALKGKTPDEIRGIHAVKRAFPGSAVQNGGKA